MGYIRLYAYDQNGLCDIAEIEYDNTDKGRLYRRRILYGWAKDQYARYGRNRFDSITFRLERCYN